MVTIPVMASYDDGTRPRLFAVLDEIRFGETLPFVCRLELLSEIVVADATGVDHGVWRQHVLGERKKDIKRTRMRKGECRTYSCTSSSILRCTTGNVDHLVFLDDLIITCFRGNGGMSIKKL
jgi:hypothetical protein